MSDFADETDLLSILSTSEPNASRKGTKCTWEFTVFSKFEDAVNIMC